MLAEICVDLHIMCVNIVGQYCKNAYFYKFQYALLHPNFVNARLSVARLALLNIQMEVLKNTKSYYYVFN